MLLYFFALANVFGGFSDDKIIKNLKPAPNKEIYCQIFGIDFIYMINLDKRPEKWNLTKQEFERYGIKPYRFSAVNGWELTYEAVQDVGFVYRQGMTPLMAQKFVQIEGKIIESPEYIMKYGQVYYGFGASLGVIGVSLSHLSILYDAYLSGFETIWVVEDDVVIHENPHRLTDLIRQLDKCVGTNGWDVLYTDIDCYVEATGLAKRPDMNCSEVWRNSPKFTDKSKIHPLFKKAPCRYGAYSMIVRRSGMKKILDYYMKSKIYQPYDLEIHFVNDIKKYGLTFDMVTSPKEAISDNAQKCYSD